MTKKIIFLPALILLVSVTSVFAQKVDKQEAEFGYIQLPLKPLNKSIKNYSSEVILAYEADIAAQKKKNEDDFQKAKAEYPQKVAEAKKKYTADSIAWIKAKAEAEKKYNLALAGSVAQKLISGSTSKPVMETPPAPYLSLPSEPYLVPVEHQKLFNKQLLAATYLKLEGYKNQTEGAVKITATLFGFENLEPELKESEAMVYDSKTSTTVKEKTYWYEMSYKHPVSIKVETPSEGVIMDEAISKLGEYSIAKTASNKNSPPNYNKKQLITELQDKIVESNMKYVSEYLASNYGFHVSKRSIIIYRVESKKVNYDDYQQAFENALSGYNLLISDNAAASEKINAAIVLWEKALTEYNPADKNCRVDSDVNIITRLNTAEAYIWLNEFTKAEEHLNKIVGLKPSRREEKIVEEQRLFIKDLRARFDANK